MSNNPYSSPLAGTDQNYSTPNTAWRYLPLGTLTLLATVGLSVFTCILLVSTAVIPQLIQISDDGPEIDGSTLLAALVVTAALAMSYLFNVVVFCMFMYRANANVRALGAEGVENTPAWCGGYWFIPLVHLIMPYKCMSEIHRASQSPFGRDWKSNVPHNLIGVWWALWVVGSLLDRVTARSERLNIQQYDTFLNWIGAAIFVGAAFALIVILRSITSLQDSHAEKAFKK